jgi:hypothetical protein
MKTRQSLWSWHHLSQTQSEVIHLTPKPNCTDHAKTFAKLGSTISYVKMRCFQADATIPIKALADFDQMG